MAAELTCKEFVELVTAYLEATLDPALERQVTEHLADCAGCLAYLDQVRQTIGLLRTLADSTIMPGTKDELLAAFRSRPR